MHPIIPELDLKTMAVKACLVVKDKRKTYWSKSYRGFGLTVGHYPLLRDVESFMK
jgi:hypothetical protein